MRGRAGYVLLEVSVSYILLSLAIVALVPVFILGLKANKTTEKVQTAAYLSQELLEEVRMRKWDEKASGVNQYSGGYSSTLGPDAGESAADKSTFDDIDDFNGWTETTVKDPMNAAVANFPGYTRTVTVSYVDANLNASASPTDYKKIVVCTQIPGRNSVCLTTLATNH